MKRNTRQGEVILSVIRDSGRPLTPLEIHQLAILQIPRLGIATTYRHIKSLSESHQVVGVDYPGQPPRYEWADRQNGPCLARQPIRSGEVGQDNQLRPRGGIR